MTQLIRGAILEGCSAAGKTSVLKAVKRVQAERGSERTVLIVGEHYSQALQKFDGSYVQLSMEEHRTLLSERLVALESLRTWSTRPGDVSRDAWGVFFLLERFHLNHLANYPEDADWTTDLEARLRNLNAMCFVLTVSDRLVRERVRPRLSAAAARHSRNLEDASAEFLEQQHELLRIAEASSVPTVVLNTDDRDWIRCASTILDNLERQT